MGGVAELAGAAGLKTENCRNHSPLLPKEKLPEIASLRKALISVG
jgi:hypothetical protein